MTSKDIRRMSEEELPDIDYFLNKLTLMTILEKNFLHPLNPKPSICHVHISAGSFPFRKAPHTVFPIKQSYKRLWLIIRVLEKRRLTDLNRWSGSCSPMPYHLAKSPYSIVFIQLIQYALNAMTPTGIEPVLPPWKGDVLTAWPRGQCLLSLTDDTRPCHEEHDCITS